MLTSKSSSVFPQTLTPSQCKKLEESGQELSGKSLLTFTGVVFWCGVTEFVLLDLFCLEFVLFVGGGGGVWLDPSKGFELTKALVLASRF